MADDDESKSPDHIPSVLQPQNANTDNTTVGDLLSSAGESTAAALNFFTCDICSKTAFDSYEALVTHVDSKHEDLLPDRPELLSMTEKVRPAYKALLEEHVDRWIPWGELTFELAKHRDAGAERLAEACAARAQLEEVVKQWNPNAKVYIFGSSVAMGLWDGLSDIDFTVVDVEQMDQGNWPPNEKNAVRSLTERLRKAGFTFRNLDPIEYARVPIIKHQATTPCVRWLNAESEQLISRSVRFLFDRPVSNAERLLFEAGVKDFAGEPEQLWWDREGKLIGMTMKTNLAAMKALIHTPNTAAAHVVKAAPLHDEFQPDLFRIDFDLSFRSFGIRNSHLLRQYLMAHPCGRPGALALKEWSKSSGVNNSIMGFFTSYAVNIMWIYYLVRKGLVPYVDPQSIPEKLTESTPFDPSYQPLIPPNLSEEQQKALYREMGTLLLGFFGFYCLEFDWGNDVISLNRPEVTTKSLLHWTQRDETRMSKPGKNVRYQMCIEDPYEENLNLGRHLGECKSRKVKAEFQRALISLIKDSVNDSCVFQWKEGQGGNVLDDPPVEHTMKLMGYLIEYMDAHQGTASPNTLASASPVATVSVSDVQGMFKAKAPESFSIVRKHWSWKQLIHKLGYKVVGDRIIARRAIGGKPPRRPREPQQAATDKEPTPEASSTLPTPGQPPLYDLTEQLVAEYLEEQSKKPPAVNPEWIVWSGPPQHIPGHRSSQQPPHGRHPMKVAHCEQSAFSPKENGNQSHYFVPVVGGPFIAPSLQRQRLVSSFKAVLRQNIF